MKNFKKLFLVPVLALGTVTSCYGSNDNDTNCPEEKKCETCPTAPTAPSGNKGETISKDGHSLTVEQSEIKVLVDENIGKTKQIYASVSPSSDTITYTSSDTTVATVDNKGVITGVTPNKECTITVKSSGNLLSAIKVNTYNVLSYFVFNPTAPQINGTIDSYVEELVLPDINPYVNQPITSIYANNFNYMPNLKSVVFPSSLTTIGANCFVGCNKLERIEFLGQIENMNTEAYNFMSSHHSLKEIKLPDDYSGKYAVVNLGDGSSLLVIKNGEYSSAAFAFKKPTDNLFNIEEMPEGIIVNKVLTNCYLTCTSIEHLSFPSTIIRVEADSFSANKNLKTINIPATLTGVATGAFRGNENLEDLIVNENNTSITSRDDEGNELHGLFNLYNEKIYLNAATKNTITNPSATIKGVDINTSGLVFQSFSFAGLKNIPNEIIKIPGNSYIYHYAFVNSNIKGVYLPSSISFDNVSNVRKYCLSPTTELFTLSNRAPFFVDDNYLPISFPGTSTKTISSQFLLFDRDFKIYYQTRTSGKRIEIEYPRIDNGINNIFYETVEVADASLVVV